MKESRALEALAQVEAQKAIKETGNPNCFGLYFRGACNEKRLRAGCKFAPDCRIKTGRTGFCDCKYNQRCHPLRQYTENLLKIENVYENVEKCCFYLTFDEEAKIETINKES